MHEPSPTRIRSRRFALIATTLGVVIAVGALAFTVDRVRSALAELDDSAAIAPAASGVNVLSPSPLTTSLAVASAPASDPTGAVIPSATPTPARPTPTHAPKPFAMDLYRRGDFVGEKTKVWCLA